MCLSLSMKSMLAKVRKETELHVVTALEYAIRNIAKSKKFDAAEINLSNIWEFSPPGKGNPVY